MKNICKISFISFLLVLTAALTSCDFNDLVKWGREIEYEKEIEMYGAIENLHSEEPLFYPNSPFDSLITKTYKTDWQTAEEKDDMEEGGISAVLAAPHYVKVLNIGEEALAARIHLIRAAKRSIHIQTFIWASDEVGRLMIYELIQAAHRGVKVKIIIDQWPAVKEPELFAFLSTVHPNLEVKHYNPSTKEMKSTALKFVGELATKFKQVNQRMHNKIFIIDDRIAITGGRNYENDYYDRGATRNFKDRDVIVTGPIVKHMTESFMYYWAFKLSIPSKQLLDVARYIELNDFKRYDTRASFDIGQLNDISLLASDQDYIKKTFTASAALVQKVQFVADKPGKNNSLGLSGGSVTAAELVSFLSRIRDSIVVQTPYLVLDKNAVKIIKKLLKNNSGVDIRISSNSLAATDSVYAYAFSYKQKKLFVKDFRFKIFEFKPVPKDIEAMMPRYAYIKNQPVKRSLPDDVDDTDEEEINELISQDQHLCIHAKTFVFDDEKVWIGSFNVDPRSANLNTEVALIIWDEKVAWDVKQDILRDMAPQNSWTIGKRPHVPIISTFSGILADILKYLPIDIWPFRYTASFELKEGKEEIPFYHPDFFEHYQSVGSFPGVELTLKEIQIRLLKAFGGIATPII